MIANNFKLTCSGKVFFQFCYFFEDFTEYLINEDKSKEGHLNINYNFLVKVYSELNQDQKIKFNKNLQLSGNNISKVG